MKNSKLVEATILALQGKLNESDEQGIKYTITYYLNTAARERRPTTREDINNDFRTKTDYFNTDLEAFNYIITDILDGDIEDFYDEDDDTTDDEKIKDIIDYFECQDFGDGEVIICKVDSKNYKYDSGLTKESFIEMAEEDEDEEDEDEY